MTPTASKSMSARSQTLRFGNSGGEVQIKAKLEQAVQALQDANAIRKWMPDGVRVSYQMHASPGGSIPNWLANQTVVDTPFGTLNALRSHLQPAN